MNIPVDFVLNKNDIRSNNTRKTSETSCPRQKACCNLEKKKKKRYFVTKSRLQNSLQYSIQYNLQNSLQYSQIMAMALAHLLSLL